MNDIFDEISADLRRDRLGDAWANYGRYVIGAAVALVVLVASVTGFSAYQQVREEGASLRYDAMLEEIEEADAETRVIRLLAFATAENNGYGALARMSATLTQAKTGQGAEALAGFDALADDGSLPDSLRDFARLQAAIILLDSNSGLETIENRLARLLDNNNGLQPVAREVLALAYIANDKPLEARTELKKLQNDAATSALTKERVDIMLTTLSGSLLSLPVEDEAAEEASEVEEAE